MDNNLQTDSIFLDFSKAFDRVAHCRLFSKLSSLGLDSASLSWILNFLSFRQQFTEINNCASFLVDVPSGVPQGSVLGPLLFLIYINDLPNNVSLSIRLFADDCIVYRKISSPDDHVILQNDINLISMWCSKWQVVLNSVKCKLVSFSRKKSNSDFSYYINNSAINRVQSYKYLGIHLTQNLSWSPHITAICAKASKTLGYTRRSLRKSPTNICKIVYLTFIRPQLEFASSI